MPPDQIPQNPDTQPDNLKGQNPELQDLEAQVMRTKEEQGAIARIAPEVEDYKSSIEKDNNASSNTYEIIKGTTMHTKLLNVLKAEDQVEKFANDIDNTVKSFLNQAFKESSESANMLLSQEVISSMSIGIQFAMMETLTASGNKGADFFNGFAKVNTGDGKSVFSDLFSLFTKFGNKIGGGGKFVQLAKRVENCTNFISKQIRKETQYGDGSKSKQLVNPNEFRKVLSNTTRDNYEGLRSKTLNDMGITVSDGELTSEDKTAGLDQLKNIVNNPNMPIDEKTIQSIQMALPNAQKFLEKRKDYKDQAIGIMQTVGGVLDINLFGLGTVGSLLGINSPDEILGKKGKRNKLVDFILRIMGFSGGLEGLHREYIYQSVEKNLHEHPDFDRKEKFVKDAMTDYKSSISTTYSGIDTITKFNLSSYDSTLISKIPKQYDSIRDSILKSAKGKEACLNPNILQQIGLNVPTKVIKDMEGKDISVIDETQFDKSQINETMISSYLDKQIPYLVSDQNFMKDIKDADHFVLAMTGVLVADKYYLEGVSLGYETVEKNTWLSDATQTPQHTPDVSSYNGEIKKETLKYEDIVDVVIDKIEGGYYHPNMNISAMGSSGETMMGIDRVHGGNLNTSNAGKEFRKLIDEDRAKNPTLRTHNYRGGQLESQLRTIAGNIIKPHYENLSNTYFSQEALNIINTDGRLKFNFVYGAWNGSGRFEKMANVINSKVTSGVKNTDDLLKSVIDWRKNESGNSLIAQGGRKIEDIVGLA